MVASFLVKKKKNIAKNVFFTFCFVNLGLILLSLFILLIFYV